MIDWLNGRWPCVVARLPFGNPPLVDRNYFERGNNVKAATTTKPIRLFVDNPQRPWSATKKSSTFDRKNRWIWRGRCGRKFHCQIWYHWKIMESGLLSAYAFFFPLDTWKHTPGRPWMCDICVFLFLPAAACRDDMRSTLIAHVQRKKIVCTRVFF